MHHQLYTFRGHVTHVVDGDTIDCDIDVGFKVSMTHRLRLHGINTPELRSPDEETRERAIRAKQLVETYVLGKDVYVQTYKDDVFGRYLARVYVQHDSETYCLNDLLVETGYAVRFMENNSLY